MSHTCHQAAKSSPRWRPPVLEFRATLDENFVGLENPNPNRRVGKPLYNLFVGKKTKSCHFGMNFSFKVKLIEAILLLGLFLRVKPTVTINFIIKQNHLIIKQSL